MTRAFTFLAILIIPFTSSAGEWRVGAGMGSGQQSWTQRLPDSDAFVIPHRQQTGSFHTVPSGNCSSCHVRDHTGSSQVGPQSGSTQTFDWEGFRSLDGSIEYRARHWIGLEVSYSQMRDIEFSRPLTQEIAYYHTNGDFDSSQPDKNNNGFLTTGGERVCRSGCAYHALSRHGARYAGEGEVDSNLWLINTKLYAPQLWDRVTPFIMLGGGVMDIDITEQGTLYREFIDVKAFEGPPKPPRSPLGTPYEVDGYIPEEVLDNNGGPVPYRIDFEAREVVLNLGIGVDLRVSERLSIELRGEYRRPQGDLSELDHWVAGTRVVLTFGGF